MLAESTNIKVAPCPSCGGTGWELVEGKGVRQCQCKKTARPDVLLQQARIPNRFVHCAMDNFELLQPSLHRALMNTKKFVEEYPVVDVGLLYLGRCGVGKTHLAVAALKEIIKKGIAGMFYDFRDLLKEIQDSYNPNTHTSELKILAPIFDADVLVLDELGASKPTEWVQETITHIINKRYNDKKVTIFTSNYLDIPIGSAYDETLTDRVGVRLRSRLHEMCRLIPMEGDDYREILKNRRGGRFSS
ncbi:MAG TPA: ATP-binding protein [Blastocatellia bacterium]|jgi:DNA replication protein DnaC|nr:ATP-binding protein [Blastocatellia bacterium]